MYSVDWYNQDIVIKESTTSCTLFICFHPYLGGGRNPRERYSNSLESGVLGSTKQFACDNTTKHFVCCCVCVCFINCRDVQPEETYFDRDVEKAFMKASADLFERKTKCSLLLSNQNGNMYTPSVYGCLASLIAQYVCVWLSFHSLITCCNHVSSTGRKSKSSNLSIPTYLEKQNFSNESKQNNNMVTKASWNSIFSWSRKNKQTNRKCVCWTPRDPGIDGLVKNRFLVL